jgi:hypothetical protein
VNGIAHVGFIIDHQESVFRQRGHDSFLHSAAA